MKLVPKGPINNIMVLFEIMARCRPGDNPLSEPVMVSLPRQIYASLGLSELTQKAYELHRTCIYIQYLLMYIYL